MNSTALAQKDANTSLPAQAGAGTDGATVKPEMKSLEYHRQVLKSKIEKDRYERSRAANTNGKTETGTTGTITEDPKVSKAAPGHHHTRAFTDPFLSATHSQDKYVSPSDGIMSPCTAKLTALKGRQVEKAKPKSLFAQASAKKFAGENVFGARNAGPNTQSPF